MATAHFEALRLQFRIRQAQGVQAILQAFCWPQHHQQVCHFPCLLLISDSRSFSATPSTLPFFILSQAVWHIWQEQSFPPVRFFYSVVTAILDVSPLYIHIKRYSVYIRTYALPRPKLLDIKLGTIKITTLRWVS